MFGSFCPSAHCVRVSEEQKGTARVSGVAARAN